LRVDDVTFVVHYRLLDDDVVLEAETGTRTLALCAQSVADFFAAFVAAAAARSARPRQHDRRRDRRRSST